MPELNLTSLDLDDPEQALTVVRDTYYDARMQDTVQLVTYMLENSLLTDAQVDQLYEFWIRSLSNLDEIDLAFEVCVRWREDAAGPFGEIGALVESAALYQRRGELDSARSSSEQAILLAEHSGERRQLALALRQRAELYQLTGDYDRATIMLRRALGMLEALNDIDEQVATMAVIGKLSHQSGRYFQAIQILRRALSLTESTHDQLNRAVLCNTLGESYQRLHAMERALAMHEEALAVRHGVSTADLERNLGVDLIGLERHADGLAHLHHALDLARAQGDKELELYALYSSIEAELSLGRVDEAAAHTDALLNDARALGLKPLITHGLFAQARIALAQGNSAQAEFLFNETVIMAQETGEKEIIWRAHAALAEIVAPSSLTIASIHHTVAVEIVLSITASIEEEALKKIYKDAPSIRRLLTDAGRLYDD